MANGIVAKVSAFLKEIEHAEEDRKCALEERIANMAKGTEDQIQIEYNERLASIKNTESQQLLKLYSKIASLKREHAIARHRETKIVSWLNSTLCQDLCERRQVRSAERLLEEAPEPPRGLVCGEDVIAQVQRMLSQGQKALDEQLKEECSKLEDKCRAARARAIEQRRKALGEAAQTRISRQAQHERLASQIRKEEEPTVLKMYMDLIRGLEIILTGDEKGDAREGARGTVEGNDEYGQERQGSQADTTKSEHLNENNQGHEPPEIQEQDQPDRELEARAARGSKVNGAEKLAAQEAQRIPTPSPAQEKVAARDIKKAWNAYVSFTKRFEKRRHYRLTFADITWPVLSPVTDANGITHTKIAKFLLSLHHSAGIAQTVRLRDALVRWDPEKFESQWMDRIVERDKRKVKEAVEAVARELLRLQAEELV